MIYSYECQACLDTFDHSQSMASGSLRKCKKCKAFKLIRLIGTPPVIFKGDPQKGDTGFHSLDYSRNLGQYDIARQRENVREHEIKRGE